VGRYVTSLMPRDGIFRDAVPSRNVAIWQPSLKIGLYFMTLGVPANGAAPSHLINFRGSATYRYVSASYSKRVPLMTAPRNFGQTNAC
jgi:hypothetical protein